MATAAAIKRSLSAKSINHLAHMYGFITDIFESKEYLYGK